MPIKGLSEKRQLPRLGKIHLGTKDGDRGFPKKTEYFVCPAEVRAVFGDQPKSLRILIPVEDEEKFASQYYRCYSKTRGLICKGDGERADRLVDARTGALADAGSKEVSWKEIVCHGKDCPDYKLKCKPIMNLQFLLPEVPGMGIWQIDTGSVNSIKQINSAIELVRALCGRIAMIPLILTLEPKDAINPDTNKKQTIYCLNLRTNGKMGELALAAGKSNVDLLNGMLALPVGDDERPDCAPEFEPDPVEIPEDNRSIDVIVEELYGAAKTPESVKKSTVDEDFDKLESAGTGGFNMEWLSECLSILNWKVVTLASWMNNRSEFKGVEVTGTLEQIINRLNTKQRENLVRLIQTMVDTKNKKV